MPSHNAGNTVLYTAVRLEDYLERKENAKQYEVTGGWHDAGDYGRYTTAAATALAHMIYAQQLFPESFTENLNIPESNDAMPDVLSECLYELRWLLKMHMEDGSVCLHRWNQPDGCEGRR